MIQKEQSYNNQEALTMFYKSKNSSGTAESINILSKDQTFKPEEVFAKVKEVSKERKFDESVEIMVKLGVDPTRGDQNIRGTCVLPAGTGKEVKVCVFAD